LTIRKAFSIIVVAPLGFWGKHKSKVIDVMTL
jgi:hypothetical protein